MVVIVDKASTISVSVAGRCDGSGNDDSEDYGEENATRTET